MDSVDDENEQLPFTFRNPPVTFISFWSALAPGIVLWFVLLMMTFVTGSIITGREWESGWAAIILAVIGLAAAFALSLRVRVVVHSDKVVVINYFRSSIFPISDDLRVVKTSKFVLHSLTGSVIVDAVGFAGMYQDPFAAQATTFTSEGQRTALFAVLRQAGVTVPTEIEGPWRLRTRGPNNVNAAVDPEVD